MQDAQRSDAVRALFEECFADFQEKLKNSYLVRPTEKLRQKGNSPIPIFDLTITDDEGTEGDHEFLKIPLMDVLPQSPSVDEGQAKRPKIEGSADDVSLYSDKFFKHMETYVRELSAPMATEITAMHTIMHQLSKCEGEVLGVLGRGGCNRPRQVGCGTNDCYWPILDLLCNFCWNRNLKISVKLEESLTGYEDGPYYYIAESLGCFDQRHTLDTSSVRKCDYICQTIWANDRVVALWITTFMKYQHAIAQAIGYFIKVQSEAHKPPPVFIFSEDSAQVLLFPFKNDAGDQLIDCVELAKYDIWCRYGARLVLNHNLLVLLLILTSDHPISDDLQQITYYSDGGTKKSSLHDHILTAKMCVKQQEAEKIKELQKLKAERKMLEARTKMLEARTKMLEAQTKFYGWLKVAKALQKLEEGNEDLQEVNELLQKLQDEKLEEVKSALLQVEVLERSEIESLEEMKKIMTEELQKLNLQDFEEIKHSLLQRLQYLQIDLVTKDQNSP